MQDRCGWGGNKWSGLHSAGPAFHHSLNVGLQVQMALAHYLFANVCLFPFSIVVPPSNRHGLWLGRSVPGMDLSRICVGPAPFSVVAAGRHMRHWSQKRTRRADALLGDVDSCLVPFAFFSFQSFLEFPSLASNGIQEVGHVGVFDVDDVELVQRSVDGGRDDGWPRGRGSSHDLANTRPGSAWGHERPGELLGRLIRS